MVANTLKEYRWFFNCKSTLEDGHGFHNHARSLLIDGIIGGEGEGPLRPKPVKSGVIILGYNPIATDIVATEYMGIDHTKVKLFMARIRGVKKLNDFSNEDIIINSTEHKYNKLLVRKNSPYKYNVPGGWKGYL